MLIYLVVGGEVEVLDGSKVSNLVLLVRLMISMAELGFGQGRS